MKTIRANERYRSEKGTAQELGMQAVAGSGNSWDKGREDFIGKGDDDRIGQSKSTGRRSAISIRYIDLFQLCQHAREAGKTHPLFVLDYEHPVVNTKAGEVELPREKWVAMPISDYLELLKH